ncbi:conserved hypothetical protein [Pseudomonas sp. 8AS]|uniref:YfjI family protein n=1 Tax=Pseudomonas sp. 8AS TaxID=2653163 RepID=UPI0012F28F12|nr:YfjI family protein [Pseudomonas sp. 8AS]VXC19238.1 conserved hypothetical protein [Pseudomonas sp. 8AS]
MIDYKRAAPQPSWNDAPLGPKEASNRHLIDDPIPALPFEITSEAIEECVRNLKNPKDLALVSAITFISLSVQGLYDARSPLGNIFPTSLLSIAVAGSGEGKTPCLNKMGGGLFDYQKEILANRDVELKKFRYAHDIWSEILKAHKSELRRLIKIGDNTDSILEVIADHYSKEPKEPMKAGFLYEDTTEPALYGNMNGGLQSIGWISSEASGIVNGSSFRNVDKINSVTSGDGVRVERATRESYYLANARITLCYMFQPSVLKKFENTRGETARGTGFSARCLFVNSKSTQGTRIFDGLEQSWTACERFRARTVELYKSYVEKFSRGSFAREEIRLSDRAAEIWIETRNEIEKQILEGGRYSWAPDHASKLAEIMIRLAVNFHVFEGREGDVSETTMRASIELGYWFSRQFERMFSPEAKLENDASELHAWLRSKYDENSSRRFDRTYIGRHCPSRLRGDPKYLELIYDKLENDKLIRIITEGKAKIILLN